MKLNLVEKLHKSIPASATSSESPTVSNAAVQVDMLPPDVPKEVNAMVPDEIEIADLVEKEVDSVINILKLPVDISDMNDSHSDYERL